MNTSPDKRRYRRSPFLILFWSEDELVLLHADTQRRFRVNPKLLVLLSLLGDWSTTEDLAEAGWPIQSGELIELYELGILQVEDDVSNQGSARFTWDPLELAVQRRTAYGGYWPENIDSNPPPLWESRREGLVTELPPPAPLPALALTNVLSRRRTLRNYAARPLRLEELSTLLYHSARIVHVMHDPLLGENAQRPFPTAGARSELEIYVISNDVTSLESGSHYYDPRDHHLIRIRVRDEYQAQFMRSIHTAAGGLLNRDPPAILLITAVFERIMWKYHDLGLSLIYKDVGCLLQTLYLVATAVGLAPCAIGGGDEAENSRWLGLDPLLESQVGCFLVGPGKHHRQRSEHSTGYGG